MQDHSKNYNGVVTTEKSCDICGLSLSSEEEVSTHKVVCDGMHKAEDASRNSACKSSDTTLASDRSKKWESQILTFGQAFCDNQDCNFIGMTLPTLEDHIKSCNGVPNFSVFCCIHCRCSFSNKEDHLKHQQNCNATIRFDSSLHKRGDSLHFRVIKKMKSKDSSEDHIIQPMPDFPKGQYRRRRPYSVQHIKSWVLSLEKFKYVKCIYQNCYFIAMSLEDMISHFGYCNGDGRFAKFLCPYCNGRVTSKLILQKHIERSHSFDDDEVVNSNSNSNSNSEGNSFMRGEAEEGGNDGFLFTDMESLSAGERIQGAGEGNEGEEKRCEESQGMDEVTKMEQSSCWQLWKLDLKELGYAFCRKSLCNFMASNISVLEIHLKTCNGSPDFEFLNCPTCSYRLPTREELEDHMPKCKGEKMRYPMHRSTGIKEAEDLEDGLVFHHKKGKSLKFYSKQTKVNSSVLAPAGSKESSSVEADSKEKLSEEDEGKAANEAPLPRKRGRPRLAGKEEKGGKCNQRVQCGKCGSFEGARKPYREHNAKVHAGLGWVKGEKPVNMSDEKLLVQLVKEAFKVTKKGTCESCGVVKKSVLGFVSHIQVCGKTDEEKDALKVECPHCNGKYRKYSLGTHLKNCNVNPDREPERNGEAEERLEKTPEPVGKRQSAIKAVSKFQQVLKDNNDNNDNNDNDSNDNNENDEAEPIRGSQYFLFEKGSARLPKLNAKLNNLWYKLKRENKKIACRHANCTNVSRDVREAKLHHFTCPLLPSKAFLCELCDFYSEKESVVKIHVTTHRKYTRHRKTNGDDEEVKIASGEEEEEDEDEDEDEGDEDDEGVDEDEGGEDSGRRSKRLKRKKGHGEETKAKKGKFPSGAVSLDVENRLKYSFCKREKIGNLRGSQFYSNGLNMTLQDEMSTSEREDMWADLQTSRSDWVRVPSQKALESFPELTESVSVHLESGKWKRLDRFGSDVVKEVPIMFVGGSVRSMSWCKVSFRRMIEKVQKQYLAVSTCRNLEQFKDVHDKSSVRKSSLVQIWDCGRLENVAASEAPKFCLGIVQEGGEVWDLAWFPEDTHAKGAGSRLERLGLLATASEDGWVRVWSVCDPEQLDGSEGLPVYKGEPKVVLTVDEDLNEACLRLGMGREGVVAGGFGNGDVAVWNLKNLSSPLCKNSSKTKTIRANLIIHAHKTTITALTFCPSSSRYISTAGMDRFVKVWDTELPAMPIEQYNKECSLDNIWTLNWPSLIYNFDDIVVNSNKGVLKFVRDIVTDRHQTTFVMEDTCLSLAFSDWLNVLCGGSLTGEVKLRPLKNLVHDQRKGQSTVSCVSLKRLSEEEGKESEGKPPRTYREVEAEFGLVFKDNLGTDKGKAKKPEAHPEEFPVRAVNKIAFNPNMISFTHIAVGYNCGLIRILPLKELQSSGIVKFFLESTLEKTF